MDNISETAYEALNQQTWSNNHQHARINTKLYANKTANATWELNWKRKLKLAFANFNV